MDNLIQALTLITQGMLTANIAIPLVFGAISSIAAIVKGATGNGPSVTELADLIEQQVNANDAAGKAEIARLKEQIGQA